MNELNKKLAEWAGFGWERTKRNTLDCFGRETDLRKWRHASMDEGIGYMTDACPNFTESLDACFKWLVPKVTRELADIDLSTDREAMYKLFSLWIEEFWLPRAQPISLALALCLAIEKLIGEKK